MIQLQGIGQWIKTKPASELRVGDVLVWNYGESSVVVSIEKTSEKSIWIRTQTSKGDSYISRYLKTREIAVK